jgi:putative FmdB family regulatory protein
MPTYEYLCSKCGHHFEISQRITENALAVCPKDLCPRKPWGKGKVKREISAGGGLLFKGSGFYTTDYRSEGYKEAAKKETNAASASTSESSKKESKSESKPSGTESSSTKGGGSSSTPPPSPASNSAK